MKTNLTVHNKATLMGRKTVRVSKVIDFLRSRASKLH